MRRKGVKKIVLILLLIIPSVAGAKQAYQLMDLVNKMFPTADSVGHFDGTPPSATVRQGVHTLGYVLYTADVSPIPAYSGKPVNSLVGLDRNGNIVGVYVVHHEEPILVVGLSNDDLEKFTSQYKNISASSDIRIGGQAKPGRVILDGISGATITTMVINRSVNKAARMVAASRELISKDAAAASLMAEQEQPLWQIIWNNERVNTVILVIALVSLFVILLIQDWLAKHPRLLLHVRTGYLVFTVIFIGVFALGQLSIVNVLTFINALLHGFTWENFLLDPIVFILWGFVAMSILLWGRGVYCGWLCPFGALQELLFRVARRFGVPEWEPPEIIHERLWALKYLVLLGLFALSLQSLATAEVYAEVEPFKTVFGLHFLRDWPYVLFAVAVLFAGLFVRKAYCRYLCPLGAALTFPGRFRVFDWLRRRKECGRPCQTCARECEVRAIRPTGEIIDTECHYCLDCQVTFWDENKCMPLIQRRKKHQQASQTNTPPPNL